MVVFEITWTVIIYETINQFLFCLNLFDEAIPLPNPHFYRFFHLNSQLAPSSPAVTHETCINNKAASTDQISSQAARLAAIHPKTNSSRLSFRYILLYLLFCTIHFDVEEKFMSSSQDAQFTIFIPPLDDLFIEEIYIEKHAL